MSGFPAEYAALLAAHQQLAQQYASGNAIPGPPVPSSQPAHALPHFRELLPVRQPLLPPWLAEAFGIPQLDSNGTPEARSGPQAASHALLAPFPAQAGAGLPPGQANTPVQNGNGNGNQGGSLGFPQGYGAAPTPASGPLQASEGASTAAVSYPGIMPLQLPNFPLGMNPLLLGCPPLAGPFSSPFPFHYPQAQAMPQFDPRDLYGVPMRPFGGLYNVPGQYPRAEDGACGVGQKRTAEAAAGQNQNGSEADNTEEQHKYPVKRSRLVWTPHLHQKFVDAVNQLSVDKAVPKTIMQLMNVDGLTRENVASHLQKYRIQLKRQNGQDPQASGSKERTGHTNNNTMSKEKDSQPSVVPSEDPSWNVPSRMGRTRESRGDGTNRDSTPTPQTERSQRLGSEAGDGDNGQHRNSSVYGPNHRNGYRSGNGNSRVGSVPGSEMRSGSGNSSGQGNGSNGTGTGGNSMHGSNPGTQPNGNGSRSGQGHNGVQGSGFTGTGSRVEQFNGASRHREPHVNEAGTGMQGDGGPQGDLGSNGSGGGSGSGNGSGSGGGSGNGNDTSGDARGSGTGARSNHRFGTGPECTTRVS